MGDILGDIICSVANTNAVSGGTRIESDQGPTFSLRLPDPIGDFLNGPDYFRDLLQDFARQSHPFYPLSNEYREDQEKLARQALVLEEQQRRAEEVLSRDFGKTTQDTGCRPADKMK